MATSGSIRDAETGQNLSKYDLWASSDSINFILGEGYEIADIVPNLQVSCSGINRRAH